MTRSIIILGVFLFLLSSCTKITEYDVPVPTPHVVIDAIISTDSAWVVKLNYLQEINSIDLPEKVEGAEIQVSVLIDGQANATPENIAQKIQLDETEPGKYTFPNNPIEGKTYHMEVLVGDEVITARTYVPKVFTPEVVNTTPVEDGTFSVEVDLGEELEANVYYAYNLILNTNIKDHGNIEDAVSYTHLTLPTKA